MLSESFFISNTSFFSLLDEIIEVFQASELPFKICSALRLLSPEEIWRTALIAFTYRCASLIFMYTDIINYISYPYNAAKTHQSDILKQNKWINQNDVK